jgi:hypothetical protein
MPGDELASAAKRRATARSASWMSSPAASREAEKSHGVVDQDFAPRRLVWSKIEHHAHEIAVVGHAIGKRLLKLPADQTALPSV